MLDVGVGVGDGVPCDDEPVQDLFKSSQDMVQQMEGGEA